MIMGDPPNSGRESHKRKYSFFVFIFIGVIFFFICTVLYLTSKEKKNNLLLKNSETLSQNGDLRIKKEIKDIQNTSQFVLNTKKNIEEFRGRKTTEINSQKIIVQVKSETKDNQISHSSIEATKQSEPFILYFNFKNHELSPASIDLIKNIFSKIQKLKGRLIIEGHTCSIGTKESNTELSKKRAQTVANTFRGLGLGMNVRMSLFSFGETNPIGDNQTPEGRDKNRRVIIHFIPDDKVQWSSDH